jgi:hypothetical protein
MVSFRNTDCTVKDTKTVVCKMESKERKIILLTDIIEQKVRKEKELEYYQRELEKLNHKMFFIRKEIDLTNFIIDLIGREKLMDIREVIDDKDVETLIENHKE